MLGVNPNVNAFFSGVAEGQLIFGQGLGSGFDVNLSLATDAPPLRPAPQELLPRWFVTENIGLVAHLTWAPAEPSVSLGPAVHSTWPIERSAVYVDVGWAPRIGPEAAVGAATWVAGGEVPVHPHLWVFLETNHRYEAGATVVLVTPGLYATFDEAGDSELCLGVRLPAVGGWEEGSVGVWFNQNVGVW